MQPTSSITLASSAPALASTVTHLPYQYIEQERVLLFADELIVQPVPLMTNPGSLTMGFAGVDPCQLAPSVGTTQVGITISMVPSSASHNSRARTRSSPPRDSRSRQTSLPPHQDRSNCSCAKTNTTVMAKYSANSKEINDP